MIDYKKEAEYWERMARKQKQKQKFVAESFSAASFYEGSYKTYENVANYYRQKAEETKTNV